MLQNEYDFSDPKFPSVGNCLHFKACIQHRKKIPSWCDSEKCELYIPADAEICYYSSGTISEIFRDMQKDIDTGKLSLVGLNEAWRNYDLSYVVSSLDELIREVYDISTIPDGFDPRDREDLLNGWCE